MIELKRYYIKACGPSPEMIEDRLGAYCNFRDADKIIKQLQEEVNRLKVLAHEGLPNECISGFDEVKFCPIRQGDGNACKHCSDFKL
jgi:hypothetical protein